MAATTRRFGSTPSRAHRLGFGDDQGPEVETHASDQPSYLAPKRSRRAYGEQSTPRGATFAPAPVRKAAPSVNGAIEAMLTVRALDWASTQLANCRGYLLTPTGRFQLWCRARAIDTIDDLTTDRLLEFLGSLADRQQGPGLKPATIAKYRSHLRALAHFQAATSGYGTSLADIDRIPKPRMPKLRIARALGREEERRVVAACATRRDRLIIELFLATGVRVSEMGALRLPRLQLMARPPRILVVGSVHDPDCTKNGRQRVVTFRKSYAHVPRALSDWIARERDPQELWLGDELFLSETRGRREGQTPKPMGIWGFEQLCQRVSAASGVHFSPHVLRHTWATRLVDGGLMPLHLMEAGGWSSVEMVRRYYSANDDEVLSAVATARA